MLKSSLFLSVIASSLLIAGCGGSASDGDDTSSGPSSGSGAIKISGDTQTISECPKQDGDRGLSMSSDDPGPDDHNQALKTVFMFEKAVLSSDADGACKLLSKELASSIADHPLHVADNPKNVEYFNMSFASEDQDNLRIMRGRDDESLGEYTVSAEGKRWVISAIVEDDPDVEVIEME